MKRLVDIADLAPDEQELLAAAGVADPASLAKCDPDRLRRALEDLAPETGDRPEVPSRDRLAGWIEAARRLTAGDERQGAVEAVLEESSFATAVAGTAEAVELRDVHGRRLATPAAAKAKEQKQARAAAVAPQRQPSIDVSRLQTFDDLREGRHRLEPVAPRPHERLPSDAKGRVSRWRRRGLEAPHPIRLYLAMLCVAVSRILFYVVAVGTPVALLLQASTGGRQLFQFLPVIVAFLVIGLIHLVIALRTKCRVCHGHLLLSRGANKNIKAHRRFPLGYAGSAALHAVIFRWFRCMYCGTPVQFGKDRNAPSAERGPAS